MANSISNINREQSGSEYSKFEPNNCNNYKNMNYSQLCDILEYNILNNIYYPLLVKKVH